jgi:glycosyltransferase involved in cell wall biosynthesis
MVAPTPPGYRPLRVLHVLSELRYSGAETMLASAAAFLSNSTINSTILSTGARIGPFASELGSRGYSIIHIPFAKSLSFFRAVRREIRKGKYDVVHIHCEQAYPFYALTAYGHAAIVRTIHHLFTFRGPLRFRKIIERAFCRKLLGVMELNNSHSGQQNERKRFFAGGVLAENWYDDEFFIPPTMDQKHSARRDLGFAEDDFILLSLGSNVAYKNYGAIIRALSRLASDMPNVKYVHVGEEGVDGELSELARGLGVLDKVRLPGRVDNPLPYMWASDCYVMPSFEEGFGIAAVEALAVGLPAVLSARQALIDFGLYFDGIEFVEPTVDGVLEGVRRMHDLPPSKRLECGSGYNAIAVEHFGAKAGAERYIAAYVDVISQTKKARLRPL